MSSKYQTLSLHYLHYPEYVLEIHENLIQILNHQKKFNLRSPKTKKLGVLGFRTKFYVTEGQGLRIRTTSRNAHNNSLIVEIDKKMHPGLSKTKHLRDLVPGHQEIFKNPIS